MAKSYKDYMNEISQDELYDRLVAYGLFSKNLPPIFDSSDFLKYCKTKKYGFECRGYNYATCYITRNINIPRAIGIPAPMSFERLCKTLSDNWEELRKHFDDCASSNGYRISRIHLKKSSRTMALFDMSYDTHGDNPELDISMGKRYVVKTDISQCFPSIYSHAIPWALVGKTKAKNDARYEKEWYSKIDKAVRESTRGETHGILIGPHTSNLISEIILCRIDKDLSKGWDYVRYIDDYEYYAKTEEEAKQFILQLNSALNEYGLLLNSKKTVVEKLLAAEVKNWKAKIKTILANIENEKGIVDYDGVTYLIEECIELMKDNNNASIIAYGVKTLSSKVLSLSAQNYIIKKSISLAILYPYLASFLDDMIFGCYSMKDSLLQKYLEQLYEEYILENNYSAASYIIQLSLKYDIVLGNFNIDEIIAKNDCILLLCGFLYSRHHGLSEFVKKLKTAARDLQSQGDMEKYWPFVYECLPATDFHGDWKSLKNNKISFIKSEYRL